MLITLFESYRLRGYKDLQLSLLRWKPYITNSVMLYRDCLNCLGI